MDALTRLAGATAVGIVLGLVAATTILRAEALLQQVRSTTLPRLGGTITRTTLDRGRSFGGQTVTPRQQAAVVASYPVLAAAQA